MRRPLIGAVLLLAGTIQTVVPVEREPQHHPVFRNAYVNVLDVDLPPGYVSLFHTHARDNVSVRMQMGTVRVDQLGANGIPQLDVAGRVAYSAGTPPYTHRVVNIGNTSLRILDVEILAGTPGAPSAAEDLSGHEVVIDNPRVLARRIKLGAGASLPAHTHAHGWLEIVVSGADAGTFRWHDPGVRVPPAGGQTLTEIVEIEPR